MAYNAMMIWQAIPAEGIDLRRVGTRGGTFVYGTLQACMLALLELFGMVEIETGESLKGEPWPILAVRRTAFGLALFDLLIADYRENLFDAMEDEFRFGRWQPLLAEYFPEWRNNLRFPEREFRDGVFYFKVSLGRVWRRIAVPAGCTLEDLAWAILHAYDFDGDHLYEFIFREQDGTIARVLRPEVDGEMFTDEFAVGNLPLEEGQEMEFHYDFGTNWMFGVKLEKIKPPDPEIQGATLIESHGEAPPEYGLDEDDGEW
ncbi:MAG: plasmid pRiA4b ORF-3 family protein [Pirellulales bacterium]|nr:plasmid pRiA4b ORF-3 family protein [Pirellulales bacterium]